jgi:hypothetical protein
MGRRKEDDYERPPQRFVDPVEYAQEADRQRRQRMYDQVDAEFNARLFRAAKTKREVA